MSEAESKRPRDPDDPESHAAEDIESAIESAFDVLTGPIPRPAWDETDEGEADEGEADERETDDGEADDGETDDSETDDGETDEREANHDTDRHATGAGPDPDDEPDDLGAVPQYVPPEHTLTAPVEVPMPEPEPEESPDDDHGDEEPDIDISGAAVLAPQTADDAQPEPARTEALAPEARADELDRAHRKRRVPRYRSIVLHWLRQSLRRPQRPTVQPLPDVSLGQVGITFVGHASALIRYHDVVIACDPMLGRWVGASKRAVAPGISPADLLDVELVLISSADPDHLHLPTLERIPKSATIVLPRRTARYVSDLDFARVVELGVGQSLGQRTVDIASAAVRFGGSRDGRALSYIIRGDGPSVFYCADSGYFSGFADVGRRFRPDIALLPIGGYAPRSFRDRHMSPLDALAAFEDLGARIMVPIRHGAFALSYEQLRDPEAWLAQLVRERDLEPFVASLAPGASRVFSLPAT